MSTLGKRAAGHLHPEAPQVDNLLAQGDTEARLDVALATIDERTDVGGGGGTVVDDEVAMTSADYYWREAQWCRELAVSSRDPEGG